MMSSVVVLGVVTMLIGVVFGVFGGWRMMNDRGLLLDTLRRIRRSHINGGELLSKRTIGDGRLLQLIQIIRVHIDGVARDYGGGLYYAAVGGLHQKSGLTAGQQALAAHRVRGIRDYDLIGLNHVLLLLLL